MVSPNGDNGTPKSRNLLILQKLQQARAEEKTLKDEAQKNEAPPQTVPNAVKKFVHKKSARPAFSSTSSSGNSENDKLRLIRRSAIQEQLFTAQCQASRQNLQKYRSTHNVSESTSSKCTIKQKQRPRVQCNSKQRYQKYNGCNNNNNHYGDDDDDDDDYAQGNNRGSESDHESNTVGVLHLKKPLKLTESEDLNYFNGSSRMKDIDWSLINGETNKDNTSTSQKVVKNLNSPKETDQTSNVLPVGDTEFINFVNNSTSNDTVYRVHNNIKESIKNTSDSPISKIQKAFNQYKADAVTVTQKIKEAFKPSHDEPKLIDLIDTVDVKRSPVQDNPSPISTLQNFNRSLNVHAVMKQIQKRNIEKFKSSQLNEVKEESINILSNSDRMAERKKMIDKYDDDMIGFVKPNSPATSSSLLNSGNAGKKFDVDENSDSALIIKKLIDKFKKSRNSKRYDVSLDSDDVSTERSSELDDLSASRRSTNSKYETLRKRLLFNVSTQTSPKKSIDKVNRNLISKNIDEVKMDKHEEEPLMKERYTRYLKKFSTVIDKTVTTEMENDISNEEPLLKPVSTRYFSTLPKEGNISIDSKCELIIKENIIKTKQNESISNKSKDCNVECDTKDINGKIEETATFSKEIDEISSDSNYIEKTSSHTDKIKEIVSDSTEIEEIVSCSKEIEKSASDTIKIEEISKNNCITSSRGEPNDNLVCKKIKTDQSSDKTTKSSCETKESEESSQLNNQVVVQTQSPLHSKEENTGYENIDSEEEFDIVNFEEFSAFTSLVSKLKAVAAAQKEHALRIANELNNNDDDLNDSQNHIKSIESSLDNTENNYSSINASISSNLDSDNENSVKSSSSSSLLLTNQNVFENVKINVEHLNNFKLDEDEIPNATKLNNETGENKKTGLSTRQLRKVNALKNYCKIKVPEGEDQAAQKNEDAVKDKILIAKESKRSN